MRPHSVRRILGRRHETEGSVAVIAVFAALALTASAALSVDIGTLFLAKRKQQAATDIAAIVAARYIGQAPKAIQAQLVANGLDPSALASIEYGLYQADPQAPAAQRFQAATAGTANAVRVKLKSVAPMYFGSALLSLAGAGGSTSGSIPGIAVQTQATATRADFAAFAVGSQLASLNGGLLNRVLGSLLGASLSLSVMDYQALASAQVDLFTFSKLLATRIGLRGATFGQLAATSVHTADLIQSLADAVSASGGSAAAAAAFIQLATVNLPANGSITLNALVDFGPFSALAVGSDAPMAVSLTALDALTLVASTAGFGHQVSIDLSSLLPGLASTTLLLAIGQPPAHSSYVALGSVGAQVHTAQTRLTLVTQVPALSPLLTLRLPIYVELASATATLSSLSCGPGLGTPTASLAVQPSLADAWIGDVPGTPYSDFSQSPSVQPAAVATVLGLAGIYGRAHVKVGNAGATDVLFTAADIAAHIKHGTTTTDFTAGLIESLIASLTLSLSPAGSTLPPLLANQAILLGLKQAAPAVDQAIDGVLGVLGLDLGDADTWVTGVRCGGGVLVD